MIKIICVGKLKEKYFKDAATEYMKRLSKFSKIELIELPDSSFDDEVRSLEYEKTLILNNIKDKDYVITLQIDGNEINSIQLSNKIKDIYLISSNITFIVGGSYGLHNDIKNRANYKLSFSKLTFPHQLFRVILLEQIYRSFKIINNERYHK